MSRSKVAGTVLLVLGALAGSPAQALFKVVGPDGSITYTDRPPPEAGAKISNVGPGRPAAAASAPALPGALREAAGRFPVTLYTAPDCAPCDEARDLLKNRGIPFSERIATSNADREAWVQQLGSNTAPALRIGGKSLLGLTPDEWNSYLDAAGYPRLSALPAGWSNPPAEPLAPRPTLSPDAAPPPAARTPAPAPAPAPAPGAFRF